MIQDIIEAIKDKNVIEIVYDNQLIQVEPYCYGITLSGKEILKAYQIQGFSPSGKMGWNLYDLDKVDDINSLKNTFNVLRMGFEKSNAEMNLIFAQL
jgi:hypothetical protein